MGLAGGHLAGLIVGVILMDLGVQSGHVSNQTRIYGHRSRREEPAEHGLHVLLFPRRRRRLLSWRALLARRRMGRSHRLFISDPHRSGLVVEAIYRRRTNRDS